MGCWHLLASQLFFSLEIISKISFLKKDFYLFLEREREGEIVGEKHQCVVASHVPPPPEWGPGSQPRHVP